ncbi:hypothetical protein DACRYDRAFT_38272, partial [Dacryopinax primogenitus]
MLPAHQTKHLSLLMIPFRHQTFQLHQSVSSESNGTSLWTGGQLLPLWIAADFPVHPSSDVHARRPRACELGSGTGLTALALASMGWDVDATDTSFIVQHTLGPNLQLNPVSGRVTVRAVDWLEPLDFAQWRTEDEDAEGNVAGGPPYDLILSADTLYSPSLVTPLLTTLKQLASASFRGKRSCPVLLCLERRDPELIDRALGEARDLGFRLKRVGQGKVLRVWERAGMVREDLEGLEIWRLLL